ncbi:MAG: sigma-70 family RNA polymerase sigma factor, partial [Planctomycetota bacterium]
QEAFWEAWRKRTTLEDPVKFGGWVCAIARHRALDWVRRVSRNEANVRDVEALETVSSFPSAEQIASSAEEKALVWSSLDAMPEKYRDVMVLYYRGDQSVTKVAEALEESEANVRQRLVRGREMLRNEVRRIVERTLLGTAPKAIFTAAVIGSLPGTASAAVAGASLVAASGSVSKPGAVAVVAKTAAAGAVSGGLVGVLGGLLGGGIGGYFGYRSAPYPSQRKLTLRFMALITALMLVCLVVISWLVHKQTSDTPLDGRSYAVALLTTILGTQAIGAIALVWMTLSYRKLAAQAKEAGEPMNADVVARQLASPPCATRWSSPWRLAGIPLLDLQMGAANSDGTVDEPLTAYGWIAIGDRAHGWLLACGNRAYGTVAMGGMCVGGITIGGFGVGLVSLCGFSVGMVGFGGLAIGFIAVSGLAIGINALGGLAVGNTAVGGAAFGLERARGGLAWSQGYSEGGLVLGGQTGDAAAAMISNHWFVDLTGNGIPNGWMQGLALISAALLIGVVLTSVAAKRLANRNVPSDAGLVLERLRQNDDVAFFGSLFGCTVWTLRAAYESGHWQALTVSVAIYVLAAVLVGSLYLRRRGQARHASAYLPAGLIMGATGTMILLAAWVWAGISSMGSLSILTLLVVMQMIVVAHAAVAIILSVSQRQVAGIQVSEGLTDG